MLPYCSQFNFSKWLPNGWRYLLRWGGDGEAVQLEKCKGVENCLGCAQNPQRPVHAVLARSLIVKLHFDF
jgi:hypothetical protein